MAYSGMLLIKTEETYLEIIYTKLDKTINIIDELMPILKSFTPNME